MAKKQNQKITEKVESLTKSLLESFEELALIYRILPGFILAMDIRKIQELILSEAMDVLEADMGWVMPFSEEESSIKTLRKNINRQTTSIINSFAVKNLLKKGKSQVLRNPRAPRQIA